MLVALRGEQPKLQKYELLEKLGQGGMGTVHLARRDESADVCIIKQLKPDISSDDVVSARFLREAQISSMLVHPNIARLTDAWREDDGNLYLAMEYVPGVDLEAVMGRAVQRGIAIPPELALSISADVLGALDYAHQLRDSSGTHLALVHRDLAPKNVMISFEGAVKVIDFGIARAGIGDFRTEPGMLVGTLRYMSPEQARAETIDARSDLYSWSVVLFEMLTGRSMIDGRDMREILRAIVYGVIPPLSSLRPDLPKALSAVLERSLQKKREDRHPTARALNEALQEATDLSAVSQQLGWFVSQLFPDTKEHTIAMLAAARRPKGSDEIEPTKTQLGSPTIDDPPLPRTISETVVVAPQSFVPTADLAPKKKTTALLGLLLLLASAGMFWAILGRSPPPLEIIETEPPPPASAPPPVIVAQRDVPPPPPPPPIAPPEKKVQKKIAAPPLPPPAPLPPPPPHVESWKHKAEALITRKEFDKARDVMTEALAAAPPSEAERSARNCLASLEHKMNGPSFDACVAKIVTALGAKSSSSTP